MNSKLKVGATLAVLLGFAGLLAVLQFQNKHLLVENADLRSQLARISSLQDSNEVLAQQLNAAVAGSEVNRNELLRLRAQSSRRRQLEQENAQLKSEGQQVALRIRQAQTAAPSPEQGLVMTVPKMTRATADSYRETTDLGSLELQTGVAAHFDLGGGTNCSITPTVLSDGNNRMEITVGVTNADGAFSELGKSRLTARPGQYCSISVADRMIGVAVTLKP